MDWFLAIRTAKILLLQETFPSRPIETVCPTNAKIMIIDTLCTSTISYHCQYTSNIKITTLE